MFAIITGGSMGLGKGILKRISDRGVTVILLDKVEPDWDFQGVFYQVDLASESSVREVVHRLNSIPQIDILVNNAAMQSIEPIESLDFELWDKIHHINLKAPMMLIQGLLPKMKAGSRILNISSVHAFSPRTNRYAYDASKAGLSMMTKELALALASRDIRVNSLSIGATDTPMNDFEHHLENKEAAISRMPLGRIIPVEEVAKMAEFILFETENATGSDFVIDGGRSL
ncbi:MAG: SDR family NAD(P)-dependent oxidoreductase [Candidatus Izemoplasmatales bacterium]